DHWEGEVDLPIGRDPQHTKKMAIRTDGRGRSARTIYRVLEIFRGFALVECYPRSGRTHQIRVHMLHLGLPLAADKRYGRERTLSLADLAPSNAGECKDLVLERHALHAASLSFKHPVTCEEMTFSAPLPEDMLSLLHGLQKYRSPPR
ncbi:MAG: pseudouridine synthase, partial [Planctomycetota bacterium]